MLVQTGCLKTLGPKVAVEWELHISSVDLPAPCICRKPAGQESTFSATPERDNRSETIKVSPPGHRLSDHERSIERWSPKNTIWVLPWRDRDRLVIDLLADRSTHMSKPAYALECGLPHAVTNCRCRGPAFSLCIAQAYASRSISCILQGPAYRRKQCSSKP